MVSDPARRTGPRPQPATPFPDPAASPDLTTQMAHYQLLPHDAAGDQAVEGVVE
jgi:hypothetical protein